MRLEKIVRQMESGDMPLEEILTHYEEGMRLKKHCENLLKNASQRIALLESDESGEPHIQEIAREEDHLQQTRERAQNTKGQGSAGQFTL